MISDLIVWGSVAFALLFTGVWALSPRWRVRIEQPKHRFLELVRRYDRGELSSGEAGESRMP